MRCSRPPPPPRSPASSKADLLKTRSVRTRHGDYGDPASLRSAFAGIERLLFISSSTMEGRVAQHRNVVEAARAAGVSLIAYTSVLHADRSPLGLAEDHRQTEALLAASGAPYVLLRNSWYAENYMASLPAALAHGALLGAAGDGRIASAARADYAAAAAAVLLSGEDQAGRTYELARCPAHSSPSDHGLIDALQQGQPGRPGP